MRKNLLKSLVAGVVALAASASANAYMMNIGGTDYTFDMIDWSAGGTAWSPNYNPSAVPGTSAADFNLYVQSTAVSLNYGNNVVYTFNSSSPFELTLFAAINETVSAEVALPGGVVQVFSSLGGSWSIYQDAAKNADLSTGAGIADGTKVLSGSFNTGPSGTFFAQGTSGSGSETLYGAVSPTPFGLIIPQPVNTVAGTDLRIGGSTTGWTQPTDFSNGVDGGTINTSVPGAYDPMTQLVMAADAQQRFIPEPTSMALVGLGLTGLAALRRRK